MKQPYIYDSFLKKAIRSLELDFLWIKSAYVPNKWEFLLKKYLLLLFPNFYWDTQLKSYRLRIFKRFIYLEAPISIGPIQSTLLDYDYLVPLINKHGIIIDAGAHIGEFAFTAEFILKAKKVYSFEPIKESFQRLQKNSKYQTFHAAISASDTQKMYIPFYNIMSSGERNSVSDREETVPSIQLDAMPELLEQRCIDLFKIDVEGMEYDVLDTSKEILKKCRYIMMEVSINRPMTRPSLITIRLLMDILPNVELIHIGKVFGNAKRADAADLLFKNNDYSPKS